MSDNNLNEEKKETLNFIEQIIIEHNKTGKFEGRVHTRFPPEPNGYLHIGHAKAICVSFGIAQKFGGKTNLRFDDTNPDTEETEFVEGIKRDVRWLGFNWEGEELYASNYFQTLYDYAVQLINQGDAYVDFSSAEVMDTEKKAGKESQYRNRSVAENLSDFEKMRIGEYEEGTCVLRAKIDMNADNWLLRDPLLYRIKKMAHHRTGDKWNIYPMYDWAHGQSDSIEGITHSLCTLEFEPHRALYDWCIQKLGIYAPQQIEFSRLNVNYTITSKRKLKELVEKGHVKGWDDPRMPTITAMRRRGYTPASIRNFIEKAGVSKREQQIEISLLDFCVREDLNKVATRAMCVLDPIKVIITNFPEGKVEMMHVENNQEMEGSGSHDVPFSSEIYIEQDDFMIDPPKKYFRLAPGQMVRLKGAYIIRCDHHVTDAEGKVTEIHCSYIENSRSGEDTSGLKVKGTLHWVSAAQAVPVELRLYERLFSNPEPGANSDYLNDLNPNSLQVTTGYAEPFLKTATADDRYQFMRIGYFCLDSDSTEAKLVFNRTVSLKEGF
jgi:glutaminyl-tRNA synthetase